MKRVLAALLLAAAVCCGCSREGDPYRVDTVVRIPVNPTDAGTDAEPLPASGTAAPTVDAAWDDGIWNGGWFETGPAETEKDQDGQNEKEDSHTSRKDAVPEWTEPPAMPETVPEPTKYTIADYVSGAEEYGVLDAVNEFRRSAGMPELAMDEMLCAIASVRSFEQSRYWSHTRPDGRDYATVLADYAYTGEAVAELSACISGEYATAVAAEMWIQSAAHGEMLLSEASCAGIGLFRTRADIYICMILVK